MKFRFRITIFYFTIVMISLGIGGFLIIYSTFTTEFDLNLKSSLDNNKFLSTIYYSIYNLADRDGPFESQRYLLSELQTISNNGQVFIGEESEIQYFEDSLFARDLENMEQGSQIIVKGNKTYLQVISKLIIEEKELYIENLVDISRIYELRDQNYQFYCIFLIVISIFSSVVIAVFSIYVTKPMLKLRDTSNLIAEGNLGTRNPTSLKIMKSPEFVNLAISFNKMADKLEGYIDELKDYTKRQDDFIARFTHELKTPLTSIIGYAQWLRTYDMEPRRRFELVNYIYKEGKRLEDLSQNLLQLILLKQEHFDLKTYQTKVFFEQLKKRLQILFEKYRVELCLEIEDATILIEPVLLESLLYNLIDNACKASLTGQEIIVSGKVISGRYQIKVIDFGIGIPDDSVSKVTLPFYMVDKSRARKQGGAGIGLALCKEIASIHGSRLCIESKYQKGTIISFNVEVIQSEK